MRRALLLALSMIAACGAPAPTPESASEAEPAPEPASEAEPAPEPPPPSGEPRAEERDAVPTDVASALASHGELAFTDGTSVYTMRADNTFEARPIGMSGPTIDGRWRRSDAGDLYEVFGTWGWMNGASRADDFRRLRFAIQPPFQRVPPSELPLTSRPVYQGFFTIDELVAITPAEHEAGLASSR